MADAGHGFRNRNSLDSRPLRDYTGAIDRRTELIDGCEGRNDKPAFVRALSFAATMAGRMNLSQMSLCERVFLFMWRAITVADQLDY